VGRVFGGTPLDCVNSGSNVFMDCVKSGMYVFGNPVKSGHAKQFLRIPAGRSPGFALACKLETRKPSFFSRGAASHKLEDA
jgi:hypothetical protein